MAKNKGSSEQQKVADSLQVRLDKWLWAARFYKTRSLAREMVQSGKVHYNGARSKPGKIVEPGAVLKVPQGYDYKEIAIINVSENRLSAPLAQQLYVETPESQARREQEARLRKLQGAMSPRPEQRPDKKQRREIMKLKSGDMS